MLILNVYFHVDTQKKLSDSNVIQLESHGKCTKTKNTSDIFAQKSPSNVQAPEKQKTDKSGIHTQSTSKDYSLS